MLPKSIGLLLSGGFFVVVHNVFPINYQWVLKVFPKMFSIVLSHTFCPKLNFHIYTYIHYKGGQRKRLNASILGSAQCLKKLWWGQSKWLLQKKIEKILVVPPQPINRNNNRCPPKWISTLNNNTLSLLFARRNTTLHYILLTSYVRQHNNLLRSQIVGFLSPVKGAGILPLEGPLLHVLVNIGLHIGPLYLVIWWSILIPNSPSTFACCIDLVPPKGRSKGGLCCFPP